MLAITYPMKKEIKVAKWGTPKKKCVLSSNLFTIGVKENPNLPS
jgi:hypothetical protein